MFTKRSAYEKLSLTWSRTEQSFNCGDQTFTHSGATKTHPSHDLSHLYIAANGELAWAPIGDDQVVRMAEYNAVFLENILCRAHYWITDGRGTKDSILVDSLKHVRWFVEEHYRPFPLSAEEAYRRFCWHINPSLISAVAPLFFDLREQERSVPHYGIDGLTLEFFRGDRIPAIGAKADFSDIVFETLSSVARTEA